MKQRILAYLVSMGLAISNTAASTATQQETSQNTSCHVLQENLIQDILNNILSWKNNVHIEIPPMKQETTLTISAVGDCTLGWDDRSSYTNSLPYELNAQNNDYSYFFRGVYDILSNDDLTIANLETTFTDCTTRADKKFTFKGPSDYTNILTSGSVEAVNLANNHTMDYLQEGYQDTLDALETTSLSYFGNGIYSVIELKGIKIGLCGIQGWNEKTACQNIDDAMSYFNEQGTDLEIFSFHWGQERVYNQNSTQENVARYAIDCGADLVLGHHPHVLQGIEEYNGKYIVYSLGNFVFGGNKNPSDKDTMIFQITFCYKDDTIIDTTVNIIPVSLSSVTNRNDYQPTVLEGEEKEKILKKVLDASTNFNYIP